MHFNLYSLQNFLLFSYLKFIKNHKKQNNENFVIKYSIFIKTSHGSVFHTLVMQNSAIHYSDAAKLYPS